MGFLKSYEDLQKKALGFPIMLSMLLAPAILLPLLIEEYVSSTVIA
jgi:hypothetical protein